MDVSFHNNINNFSLSQNKRQQRTSIQNFNNHSTFNGNLTQATEKFANKLVSNPKVQNFLKTKGFNKFLKTSIENPGLYEALIALGITCTARPLTVLATPGAKMEDKQYASAQSISSGLVGLASAYLMFDPITKALDDTLVKVNDKNITDAFKNFYANPENAKLITRLAKENIIPDVPEFNEMAKSTSNIYGYMKKYFIKNGQKAKIDELLTQGDVLKVDNWRALTSEFSNALNNSFQQIKNNGIPSTKKYLVHRALEFQPELKYNICNSAAAEKMKFILGYSSKFLIFPLLAASTVWAIPKIMKVIFPNHKKSNKAKAQQNKNIQTTNTKNSTVNFKNLNTITALNNNSAFTNFQKPALSNQQVSFSGGAALNGLNKIYNTAYKNPISKFLNKIYSAVVYSKPFSNKMGVLMQDDTIVKHGMKVLNRDGMGKILKKHDTNAFVSNLSDIIAIWGSCLYITNTIRNKEIEPERKPALCTNMGLVAIFSFIASKHIGKISDPIFNSLQKVHSHLMNKKLNYNAAEAWKSAKKILVTTFAFRYLGPVLATPAADKIVKFFGKQPNQKAETKK